jgi:opacity protein-like surface antigen
MASPERVAEPREGYVMASVKTALLAGVAALLATAANAADLPLKAPPIQEYVVGGWYLRGDIGMTNQSVGTMHQGFEDVTTERFDYRSKSFDSSPLFGIGIGYQYNNWLRFDVTGEYRSKANLHATAFGDAGSIDDFHGSKSEFTFLANAYVDLGTWYNITPFIGAGVGTSYNRIHDFYDNCAAGACAGQITAVADGTGSKWSFAWALHAGLSYEVTPAMSIELAYRYINLGDAQSGYFHNVDPLLSVAPGPYQFRDLTSHDVKLGIRWMLEPPMPMQPVSLPPLMRRG